MVNSYANDRYTPKKKGSHNLNKLLFSYSHLKILENSYSPYIKKTLLSFEIVNFIINLFNHWVMIVIEIMLRNKQL